MNLPAEEMTPRHLIKRAESLGRVAHECGKTLMDNPYSYETSKDEAEAWRRGWESCDDVLL